MSASNKPRPKEDELFEEPDYDKFSDAELDALYRGDSLESVEANRKPSQAKPEAADLNIEFDNDDFDAEEIDPELARELREEMDNDLLAEDDDWEGLSDDEFDEL